MSEQRETNRFEAFLEETYNDGTWEYGDGEPMTEDIHAVLTKLAKLARLETAVREVRDELHHLAWAKDSLMFARLSAKLNAALGPEEEREDEPTQIP